MYFPSFCNNTLLVMYTMPTRQAFIFVLYPMERLSFSTDRLSGRKKAKERITALVCANMDGRVVRMPG